MAGGFPSSQYLRVLRASEYKMAQGGTAQSEIDYGNCKV